MSLSRMALSVLFAALCLHAQTARYYVVFLRPVAARTQLSREAGEALQAAHMANIQKMARDGVLAAAGPFDDTPATISGMFVMKAASLQEAQAIAARDPTVIERRNTVEAHAWLGPKGIGDEYFRLHTADPMTPENMQIRVLCLFYRGPAEDAQRYMFHLKTHLRLMDDFQGEGRLSAAGPVEAPDDLVSLVIFKPSASLEDAQRLLSVDGAVKEGALRVEYHRWWSADHVLPR